MSEELGVRVMSEMSNTAPSPGCLSDFSVVVVSCCLSALNYYELVCIQPSPCLPLLDFNVHHGADRCRSVMIGVEFGMNLG